MVIFHSYVKLPEGSHKQGQALQRALGVVLARTSDAFSRPSNYCKALVAPLALVIGCRGREPHVAESWSGEVSVICILFLFGLSERGRPWTSQVPQKFHSFPWRRFGPDLEESVKFTWGDLGMCCNLFKIDVQWPQDVSTSPWLPQWIYVLLVGLVTTLFLAFQIVHLMDFFPKFGWFYFVFLTNWALVLESVTLLLLWVSTIWAYGSAPGEGQKAPLFVRDALSLWYIIQPMSLVVVILYWTVVNQFWDPYAIEFSSLWAHLLNWMVLIVHLFVSNLPWLLDRTNLPARPKLEPPSLDF